MSSINPEVNSKHVFIAIIFLFFFTIIMYCIGDSCSGPSGNNYQENTGNSVSSPGGYTRGYYRRNGTYVRGYHHR